MKSTIAKIFITAGIFLSLASVASADHSWGSYHWAATSTPLSIKLGDNLTSSWDPYLATASTDWSVSSVLNTTIVSGLGGKNCRPTLGRIEVCNNKYGNNGWLGIAQIWINESHITQAITKLNDTYFSRATYNTPAWKQFVVCQEVGHAFGLDHQDEGFDNPNLGTCMDYTNNPSTNQHPNTHDYEQLESIYSHIDPFTTILNSLSPTKNNADTDTSDKSEWGKSLSKDGKGRDSSFEKNLGGGKKVLTHIIWAD